MVLYTNNVPQATQTIALTQPLIQANFSYLPLFGNVDHDFASDSTTTTNGFHKKVTFKTNQAAPGFGAGVSALYADTVNGVSALSFQNVVGSFAITGKNPSIGTDGYTCLPGGLILQWGLNTTSLNGSPLLIPVSFPIAFPNNVFNVTAFLRVNTTSGNKIASLYVDYNPTPGGTFSTLGCTFVFSSSAAVTPWNSGFYWLAIGN